MSKGIEEQLNIAKAMLQELLSKPATDNWGQGNICEFCGGWLTWSKEIEENVREEYAHIDFRKGHTDKCIYTRVRHFLEFS